MNKIILVALTFLNSLALAETHDHHHVRHNMVVYGVDEVHASHIVYNAPHNFQVILKVMFPVDVQTAYRAAKLEHPSDTFIFLLDPIDIGNIRDESHLTGALFRRGESGERFDIAPTTTLYEGAFEIVYFQELPLSLAGGE